MKTKIELRSAVYMLIWVAFAYAMKVVILETMLGVMGDENINFFGMIFGMFAIVMGFVISFMEKWDDLPFLWWKTAPTENWAMGGLGVFGNSASVTAIGIVFAAANVIQAILYYVVAAGLMLAQRYYLTKKLNARAEKFMHKDCVALEDFNYKGNVSIDNEKHKVTLVNHEQIKKGEALIVTGMKGHTILATKF